MSRKLFHSFILHNYNNKQTKTGRCPPPRLSVIESIVLVLLCRRKTGRCPYKTGQCPPLRLSVIKSVYSFSLQKKNRPVSTTTETIGYREHLQLHSAEEKQAGALKKRKKKKREPAAAAALDQHTDKLIGGKANTAPSVLY